jgi:hypothetical protein
MTEVLHMSQFGPKLTFSSRQRKSASRRRTEVARTCRHVAV